MDNHQIRQPDYGTGQKKLSVYLTGFIICSILTLIAFWAVMSHQVSKDQAIAIIFVAAFIQFLVQVIFFLRLNTQTEQGQMNVMVFVFTVVILLVVILGTLWIMWNLGYNMTPS